MRQRNRPRASSRREFLTEVAAASAVVAGGLTMPSAAPAAPRRLVDQPHKLDLGVSASPNVAGAVLVPFPFATFVVFNAVEVDEDGNEGKAGTAVIELRNCCAQTYSYPGDDDDEDRPPYFGDLDNAQIYEIENSTYLADAERKGRHPRPRERHVVEVPVKPPPEPAVPAAKGAAAAKKKPKPPAPFKMVVTIPAYHYPKPGRRAKHFAMTFRGTTFHCVADRLVAELRTEPFAEIVAGLARIGAGD